MLRRTKEVVVSGGKLETLLGAGTSLTGTLKAEGNVRIEGTFEGSLEALGNLVIGPKALVKAEIKAKSVQVWGMVEGSIVAQGRLEILRKGRVLSDIEVSALLIDDDAVFRGKCLIRGATELPETAEAAPDAGESEASESTPEA